MTEQLPVPVSRKTAIAKERTTPQIVVPALIADLGEQSSLALHRIFQRQHQQPEHAPRLWARLPTVSELVRRARPDTVRL
jgi:hypothetical protein